MKPQDCRKTLDELERHLRVLQSLGEDTNKNNLRFLFMEKFPEDVIYELKLKLKTESTEEIRKQLNAIITAKEDVDRINAEDKNREPTFTTETLHVKINKVKDNNNKHLKKFTGERKFKNKYNMKPKGKPIKTEPGTSTFSSVDRRKRPYEANNESRNQYPPKKRDRKDCIFCHGDHFNDSCPRFTTLAERRGKLSDRCFICFKYGHRQNTCRVKHVCHYCKARNQHNRALCPKKRITTERTVSTKTFHVSGDEATILQTAIVNVIGQNGQIKKCRVLLDSGSQRSYITQTEAQNLNLEPIENHHLFVFIFGSEKPRELDSPLVKFAIQTRNDEQKVIFANVVLSITQGIHYPKQNLTKWIPNSKHKLADDGSLSDRIDILIGNDYYLSFLSTNKIQLQENLYLVDTEIGWILSGKPDSRRDKDDNLYVLTYSQASWENKLNEPDPPLDTGNVKSLWELESIGITDSPTINRDEIAIKHFNKNTIFKDNRYFVSWPWNEYPPDLQSNIGQAHGRLISLLKRMDLETLHMYDQTLQEQLESGVIETVKDKDITDHPIHYLSHHGVSAPGKKLRIVYDASAKTKDSKSLNECMYCGPMMLEDLCGLLIKFRCHKIGITADVEKAFLQIGLNDNDRDVTRFLWLKDVSKPAVKENLIHLRFTRVPFGIISSPFLLNATIKMHLSRSDNDKLKNLANNIYVDNVLTGTNSVEEATKLYKDSKDVFKQISMNLREWSSNSKEFMQNITDATTDKTVKTLGLNWDLERDSSNWPCPPVRHLSFFEGEDNAFGFHKEEHKYKNISVNASNV
ncbi:uncharacterized protein LOC125239537 [Leguminivora glycinivorella]|uniref:uncharacterized protein LOC125239537 n=1 Tax=Leguminivora glycinivorella TaxID=1035111 RepID=UPI00200D7C88|nr:uncharacterized protein LOC125239537 [Leguminivora glycinivorella]